MCDPKCGTGTITLVLQGGALREVGSRSQASHSLYKARGVLVRTVLESKIVLRLRFSHTRGSLIKRRNQFLSAENEDDEAYRTYEAQLVC